MRISDWSSDVCSSDLFRRVLRVVPDRGVVGAVALARGRGRGFDARRDFGTRRRRTARREAGDAAWAASIMTGVTGRSRARFLIRAIATKSLELLDRASPRLLRCPMPHDTSLIDRKSTRLNSSH